MRAAQLKANWQDARLYALSFDSFNPTADVGLATTTEASHSLLLNVHFGGHALVLPCRTEYSFEEVDTASANNAYSHHHDDNGRQRVEENRNGDDDDVAGGLAASVAASVAAPPAVTGVLAHLFRSHLLPRLQAVCVICALCCSAVVGRCT